MPPYLPPRESLPVAVFVSSSSLHLVPPDSSIDGAVEDGFGGPALRVTVEGAGGGPSAAVIGGTIAAAAAALAATIIAAAVAWRRRVRRRQAAAAAAAGPPPMFTRKPPPWGEGEWDAPPLTAAWNHLDGVTTVPSQSTPATTVTVNGRERPAGDSDRCDCRGATAAASAAAADSAAVVTTSLTERDADGHGSRDSDGGDGGNGGPGGDAGHGWIDGNGNIVGGVPLASALPTPLLPSKVPGRHRKRRRRQAHSHPPITGVTFPPPIAHPASGEPISRSPGESQPPSTPTSGCGGGGGTSFWSYVCAPNDGDSEVRLDRALAGLAAAVREGVTMPAEAAAAVAAAMEAAAASMPPLPISPRAPATAANSATTTNNTTGEARDEDGVPLRLPRLNSSEVWHGFHPPTWAVACGFAPARVASP
ncbi:hypothetical protein MMPV_004467 [Pyropia vietnamensis]